MKKHFYFFMFLGIVFVAFIGVYVSSLLFNTDAPAKVVHSITPAEVIQYQKQIEQKEHLQKEREIEIIYQTLKPYINPRVPEWMAKDIIRRCLAYDRTGLLLISKAIAETNFRFWITNGAHYYRNQAWGLLQIKPYYWADILKKEGIIKDQYDLFDYKKSIPAANFILMKYYEQTRSWWKAIYLYCGRSRRHVNKVLAIYARIKLALENNHIH